MTTLITTIIMLGRPWSWILIWILKTALSSKLKIPFKGVNETFLSIRSKFAGRAEHIKQWKLRSRVCCCWCLVPLRRPPPFYLITTRDNPYNPLHPTDRVTIIGSLLYRMYPNPTNKRVVLLSLKMVSVNIHNNYLLVFSKE